MDTSQAWPTLSSLFSPKKIGVETDQTFKATKMLLMCPTLYQKHDRSPIFTALSDGADCGNHLVARTCAMRKKIVLNVKLQGKAGRWLNCMARVGLPLITLRVWATLGLYRLQIESENRA